MFYIIILYFPKKFWSRNRIIFPAFFWFSSLVPVNLAIIFIVHFWYSSSIEGKWLHCFFKKNLRHHTDKDGERRNFIPLTCCILSFALWPINVLFLTSSISPENCWYRCHFWPLGVFVLCFPFNILLTCVEALYQSYRGIWLSDEPRKYQSYIIFTKKIHLLIKSLIRKA